MRSWNFGFAITHKRTSVSVMATMVLSVGAVFASRVDGAPQGTAEKAGANDAVASPAPEPGRLGVLLSTRRACPGYNLISPAGETTFLFDNEGRVVHSWTCDSSTGVAYLLDNGHLFRTAQADDRSRAFQGPAIGGRIQEIDWNGNVVWDFEYHSEKRLPHHDAIKLPNGNALLICWEMISEDEAVARGRKPETVKESHLQPDCLVEIMPTGLKTGQVVWEWRSWDHLIQDLDRTKPNFGHVADHPERFNLNYIPGEDDREEDDGPIVNPDWMHVNAVAYNADLDQVVLSSPSFSEIWIIDHSTTTEEAKGHTGGRWGRGGDILYRWGNPRAYRNGTKLDQRLFRQHNIQWIPKGLPGEGHLLVFNNGPGRQPEAYSSADEFEPPTDQAGNYLRRVRTPFGPDSAVWSYNAPNKTDLFSWFISGAQRLSNGNTLINAGAVGIVFEVTPEKELVWKFANPFKNSNQDRGPRPLNVFGNASRDELDLKEDQRKSLDAIDDELNAKLDEVLTTEQKRILTEPNDIDAGTVPAGEYLALFENDSLDLTNEQAEAVRALQSEFNPKIAMILSEDQKQVVESLKKNPTNRRAGRRPPMGNTLFRATRYELNHPAFAGKTMSTGETLVEIEQQRERSASGQN